MCIEHRTLLRVIFYLLITLGFYASTIAIGICGDNGGCREADSGCSAQGGCGHCRSSESDNKSFISNNVGNNTILTRQDGSIITKGDSTSDIYICPDTADTKGTIWRLGWSTECAIPKNGLTFDGHSNKSCVIGEDFWRVFLNDILTFGISTYMEDQFCSAEVGNPGLEGGIVDRAILKTICPGGTSPQECYKTLLKGYSTTMQPFTNIPLTADICSGIPNIHKPALIRKSTTDDTGYSVTPYDNPNQKVYCPLTRCDIPTNDIKIKYYDPEAGRLEIMAAIAAAVSIVSGGTALPIAFIGMLAMGITSLIAGNCCGVADLKDGDVAKLGMLGIIKFTGTGGKADGDMICAKMSSVLDTKIACKLRPDSKRVPPITRENCYLDNSSCTKESLIKSQAVIPLTSRMMQCVNETLYRMFLGGCPNNPIVALQDHMRTAIKLALTLYVIFFGLKIVMGGELPKKQELFMFVAKIGLVIWLSVGSFTASTAPDDGRTVDAAAAGPLSPNGLQWLFSAATHATNSFAHMISNGINLNICTYTDSASINTYGDKYSYLALWDMLDCRIGFYLGFLLPNEVGKSIMASPVGGGLTAGIFELVLTAILSFNVLLLLFLVLFGVMLLSVVVYLAHLYVIAMIAIAILIFVGPIFVPMLLFERTKQYFTGWIRLILGYTLQPAIIVAFIMLMMSVFDSAMYSGSSGSECQFTRDSINISGNPNPKPYWIMNDNQSAGCKNSLGYFLMTKLSGLGLSKQALFKDAQLFPFIGIVMGWAEMIKVIGSLALCAFFAFLFYYFGEQLSGFAAELSGSSNIGSQTGGANAVTNLVKAAAEIGLNVATDGAYGKAKKAASAVIEEGDNASAKIEGASGAGRDGSGNKDVFVTGAQAPGGAGGGGKPEDPGIAVSKEPPK